MKRIAVLTSGGDAPGMNAAIRAVVRAGVEHGLEVFGVRRGYAGLVAGHFTPMDRTTVVNIVHSGGTILGTGRSEQFRTLEGQHSAAEQLALNRINGLVLIGGDGTFRGASALASVGGPAAVGIPATIDNDVFGADRSLGFDTAVNTALGAIDRIRDTATSHELLHFVEVMGRESGWLAVSAGLAGGAEAVFCPEIPSELDATIARLRASVEAGKRSVLIVVAEGYGEGAHALAAYVGPRLDLDYRVTTLGHTQRGGSPTAIDRTTGATLGVAAVDALVAGRSGVVVGERSENIVETPFEATWSRSHEVPANRLALLHRLG